MIMNATHAPSLSPGNAFLQDCGEAVIQKLDEFWDETGVDDLLDRRILLFGQHLTTGLGRVQLSRGVGVTADT